MGILKESLNYLTHAYNCTKNEATGFSPYFLLFGREPRLVIDNILEGGREQIGKGSYHESISNWREAMDEAHKIAFERSKRSKHREQTLDYTALEVGDRVLVKKKGTGRSR